MCRTKIIVRSSTTEEEVIRACPKDFVGHVTFCVRDERDVRLGCKECIIHHDMTRHYVCVIPEEVYANLGIEIGGAIRLPLFLF